MTTILEMTFNSSFGSSFSPESSDFDSLDLDEFIQGFFGTQDAPLFADVEMLDTDDSASDNDVICESPAVLLTHVLPSPSVMSVSNTSHDDSGEFSFAELSELESEQLSRTVSQTSDATENKRRTRTPSYDSKSAKGNNMYGRRGKRRCQQCRTWRQKCEYENIDDPCTNCAKRGAICTAADKTWGERRESRGKSNSESGQLVQLHKKPPKIFNKPIKIISYQPSAIGEKPRGTLDSTYISFFHDILAPSYIEETGRTDGHRLSEWMLRRFGPGITSNSVRSAVLLYSSFFKEFGTLGLYEMGRYYSQFTKHTNEAIKRKQYADVVYACHTMCMYGFISGMPFRELIQHANGFLQAFHCLDRLSIPAEELFLLRCMCKDIFCWLTGTAGRADDPDDLSRSARIESLYRLENLSGDLFRDELEIIYEAEWMQTGQCYLRIQMLMYRLQISFEFYVVKNSPANNQRRDEWFPPFVENLRNILKELAGIISENPQIRSLVDRSQLFQTSTFNDISAALQPPADSKAPEFLLWQPSLLAHYKSQFLSLVPEPADEANVENGPGTTRAEAIALGMSTCRLIGWQQNKSSTFKMNSLSSLRSLIIAGLLMTQISSDEFDLQEEFVTIFNLQKYLRKRSVESPLTRYYDEATMKSEFSDITALRVDVGGFLNCDGTLRGDNEPLCPRCGRLTCDALEMESEER